MRYAQITFWDFIVDVVPGATAILLGTTLLSDCSINRLLPHLSVGLAGSLAGLIVSYVVGTVIQDVARRVDARLNSNYSVKRQFKARMDEASDDDHRTIRRRFFHGALLFFDDTDAESYEDIDDRIDVYQLFDMVQSYLLDGNVGRLYRFMLLMHFFRSLYVIFLFFAAGHLLVSLGGLFGMYSPVLGWTGSLIMAVPLAGTAVLCYQERNFFQGEMIDSMISDFYSTVLSRDDIQTTQA